MPTPHDPFGLLAFLHWNHDWNRYHFDEKTLAAAVDQIKDLGVSFVRLDILWSDVQPDGFAFDRYDRIIDRLAARHIQVLALLQYNRLAMAPEGPVWNRPPDSDAAFAAYAETTVSRYKDVIKHWEVWNEPNHPAYWSAPKDRLVRYLRLLRATYPAIKRADPAAVVLNGGLTEPVLEDVGNLYAGGGKDLFDVLAVHVFVDPLSPQSASRFDGLIRGVEAIMEEHGDAAKKIWITEMGCPGVPPGLPKKTWFSGEGLDEEQQADWLERQYAMVRAYPRVEKLFWAFYRDTDNEFKDSTDHLGLVRFDLHPKPAFFRLKNLIRQYHRAAG